MATTPVKGYNLTLKVGTKIIMGLETTGFQGQPNFEELSLKEDAGDIVEELTDFDTKLTASGRTYAISSEGATHNDFNTLRLAAKAGTAVAFTYGRHATGKRIASGNAYIMDYTEDADSTKNSGKYTLQLEAVKGSVTFGAFSA